VDFNSPQPDEAKSSLDTDGGHDSVAESPAGGGAGGSTSPGQRRGGFRPGAGRKPIEFDLETATKLGTLGCSNKELAAFFGTTERTIERRLKTDRKFAEAVERGDALGCVQIKRNQFKLMEAGNAATTIHLGKVRCGQRYVTELSGPNGRPIQVSMEDFDEILDQARKRKSRSKTR